MIVFAPGIILINLLKIQKLIYFHNNIKNNLCNSTKGN